jgi:hypothetical protein
MPNLGKTKLSIKGLLFAVTVIAIGIIIGNHLITGQARFEISHNGLELNDENLVEGYLQWTYTGTEHKSDEPWPFVCEIKNVDRPSLLQIKTGMKSKINYRAVKLGPLKKQDPYLIYFERVLGIPKSSVIRFAITKTETRVYIQGTR